MESKTSRNLSLFIIGFALIIAFSLFNYMPEQMPTHWNEKGEIDGYGNRFVGLLLFPIIMLIVFAIFHFLPSFAVFKKNIQASLIYINDFKVMMMLFFLGLYIVTLLPNFGFHLNMQYFILVYLFLLFYYIGHILPKIKRNYFFGIRTPWTLANDKVWEKTHILGGKLFKISAFAFILAFYEGFLFWVLMIVIFLDIIIIFVYSYIEYKKSGGSDI